MLKHKQIIYNLIFKFFLLLHVLEKQAFDHALQMYVCWFYSCVLFFYIIYNELSFGFLRKSATTPLSPSPDTAQNLQCSNILRIYVYWTFHNISIRVCGTLIEEWDLHCKPGLLKVESCRFKKATRKSQFNLQAFTFTTFACSFTTFAWEADSKTLLIMLCRHNNLHW